MENRCHRITEIVFSLGFPNTRDRGSHFFYRHPDGRTTTIPNHPGEIFHVYWYAKF
jgi:predicted RNA binding protein YcfA (HicA-like mRNA interferase family)